MRKLILIATMSLLASQANAGGSRSLSLAATNASQQTTEQPATAAPPQAAQASTKPPAANVQTATSTSTSTQAATSTQTGTTQAATTAVPVAETAKPKQRKTSTEARVIRELHRYGIYW